MGKIELTDLEIAADISMYRDRILRAQQKLSTLPTGKIPFKEHQKREKARKECEAEIDHVQGLILEAETALSPEYFIKKASKKA